MRTFRITLLLTAIFPMVVSAQEVKTFQEADSLGFSFQRLDSIYASAVHAEDSLGVFKGEQEEEFLITWNSYMTSLMDYLGNNGLSWGKPTKCFVKVYFQQDGAVDYWLYNFFSADAIPQELQHKFGNLVHAFSAKHKIPVSTGKSFTQCSSVQFIDMKKE